MRLHARLERGDGVDGPDGPPPQTPPAPGQPAPPGGRRGALVAGVAVAAVAVLAAAFAAGTLIGGGAKGPAPIPAVASEPVKPHKGQTQAAAIYAAASPAVVSIVTNAGSGTGFLIDAKGLLVTNDHVVDSSAHVTVQFGQQGAPLDGDVLGADPSSDLAVVAIDPHTIPKGTTPLKFADSRAVHVGDTVIAIGNPLRLDRTATEGIVSGLGRTITAPNQFQINDVIQTDAPINPGNSGGPLLDDGGNVIGVNSQIATAGSQGNIGIGFAVPSNTVRAVVPVLEKGQTVKRPWLGVRTSPTALMASTGAQVQGVTSGSPADRGGVHVGDVITRVDATTVHSPDDVGTAVSKHQPGDQVGIVVRRGNATRTLHVTLGTRPAKIP